VPEDGSRDPGRAEQGEPGAPLPPAPGGRLTEEELKAWGEELGRALPRPVFVALRGDLAAGKSTLARAIAHGAGVSGDVLSPTFNLMLRYSSPAGEVVHLDLYRLEDPEEVWELGWEELGRDGEIVMVEWPERAGELLPAERIEIELEEEDNPVLRRVRMREVASGGSGN
jgi:tRNA threonylcarbamoyladenosine biosynthesis protein TsaE